MPTTTTANPEAKEPTMHTTDDDFAHYLSCIDDELLKLVDMVADDLPDLVDVAAEFEAGTPAYAVAQAIVAEAADGFF